MRTFVYHWLILGVQSRWRHSGINVTIARLIRFRAEAFLSREIEHISPFYHVTVVREKTSQLL